MKLSKDKNGFGNLLPMVLAIVITFAVLYIGTYVNAEISDSLTDSYPDTPSGIQDDTWRTMNNTSANYDSALGIVQVVIIITLLASAIGAIFIFTRFGG